MTNYAVHKMVRRCNGAAFSDLHAQKEQSMSSATYKIAEARAHFSELLERAKEGEEILITKGKEPQARIVPPVASTRREAVPLKHLDLPEDLFDTEDPEQAAIDVGDYTDEVGVWSGQLEEE
jgi:prevent-host-death family protein